jgi:class 3 adenylate cyclase
VTLRDDLHIEVQKIFADLWTKREGRVVPEAQDLGLGNEAVLLEGVVLYADLSGSTKMVDSLDANIAAEIYKAFLHCAAKIIKAETGVITAYDGDRIMAVFAEGAKNTAAARTALKINWAVINIVNPRLKGQYPKLNFTVKHVVGIDSAKLWVARTGVRGSNDLVWVGRAANYAAKLTELDPGYPSWMTDRVFNSVLDEAKLTNGKPMWEPRTWTEMGNIRIYRSSWWWKP